MDATEEGRGKSSLNWWRVGLVGAMAGLCALMEYCSHFVLKIEVVYTHLFYIPIIFAALWWGLRGGLLVSLILSLLYFLSRFSDIQVHSLSQNVAALARGLMFIVIGLVVGRLGSKKNQAMRNLEQTQAQLVESREKIEKWSEGLKQQVEERTHELTTLLEVSRGLGSTLELEEVMDLILDCSFKTIRADIGSVMLLDKEKNELVIKAARGLSEKTIQSTRLKPGEGIAGWVAQKEKPLLLFDISKDPRFKDLKKREKLCSGIVVPLKVKGKLVGVMNVGATCPRRFTEEDLGFLSALAGEAAIAVHNAQLFDQLQELHLETVKALIAAIEAKDPYTRGHSERVAKYSLAIASSLGLSREEKEVLRVAALLHDVGKIGVKEKILSKPGRLTEEEYEEVKDHPQIATQIIGHIPLPEEVIPIIFHHHERYDGRGYAGGLKGEEIPLGARILAVADAFDAMTSARPHRPALGSKEVIEELKRNAGSQFDPRIISTFLRILGE